MTGDGHRPIRGASAANPQPIGRTADARQGAFRHRSDMSSEPKEELRQLERIADTGGSSETPLILLAEVWVVCAIAVVVLVALALLAYRLAS